FRPRPGRCALPEGVHLPPPGRNRRNHGGPRPEPGGQGRAASARHGGHPPRARRRRTGPRGARHGGPVRRPAGAGPERGRTAGRVRGRPVHGDGEGAPRRGGHVGGGAARGHGRRGIEGRSAAADPGWRGLPERGAGDGSGPACADGRRHRGEGARAAQGEEVEPRGPSGGLTGAPHTGVRRRLRDRPMDLFFARQPIFDREDRVVGYELLYRPRADSEHAGVGNVAAMASQVIVSSVLDAGVEKVTNGTPAWVNVPRELLVSGALEALDPRQVVIEVLESVEPDDEVVAACRRLTDAGYRLALDDVVF